jgi:YVTN family beta-propeller protein
MAKKLKPECFDIVNSNGKPVLFRTADPSFNKFTFKIINLTGEDLGLNGGKPAKPTPLLTTEEEGSTFNFNFESMLTQEVVKNMTLVLPDDWDKEFFEGSESLPPSWSVAPAKNIVLKPNDFIKIELSNITCATTQPGNFEIMYKNIPGYTDLVFPIAKHLDVVNPPDPDKKTLPLDRSYINPVHPIQGQTLEEPEYHTDSVIEDGEAVPVYITYDTGALIQNGFTYVLKNTSKDPLVKPSSVAMPDTGDADPPVLYISFLFGDEDYDITSQSLGDNNITIGVDSKLTWQPTKHIQGTAYWQFNPQSPEIIEGYGTVYFPIRKIITQLNVDPDKISLLFIQLNNIPGYNDAAYTLSMQKKKAEAKLEKLEANLRTINYGENIKLTWVSFLAKRVTIDYKTRDDKEIILDSAKGDIKLDGTDFILPIAPSAELTVIKASAYDNSSTPGTRDITINVIQPQAAINLFKADPQLVDVINTSAKVNFTWEVANAKKITITTPDGDVEVTDKTSFPYTLQKTFAFILNAYSYGTQFPAPTKRLLRVYAYRPGKPIPIPSNGDSMQTLPAILINNAFGLVYAVDNSNNIVYQINVKTDERLPKTFPGSVIALSQNGAKLFIYNPDPANFGLTMYDVATGAASQRYDLGMPVYQMIVSPDLTRLYCAATHNLDTVKRVIVDAANNKLEPTPPTTVQKSPRAFAFNADNTKLFVANYDSGSVSVLDSAGGTVITTFPIGTREPLTFALKKSANKLYLACEGENYVVVIETVGNTVLTKIAVQNRPSNALLSPNGKYLYVANFGASTVSVVDTETDTVVSTLTVGTAPLAMGLNSDGNVFFVGNYCSKTLSVVDINNNVVLPQQLATGEANGNPFDMVVYTEGNDYAKVYVAKESFPPRVDCPDPKKNTSLEIAVFSIQKP